MNRGWWDACGHYQHAPLQRRYGANPQAVACHLPIGKDYTVVGVAVASLQLDGMRTCLRRSVQRTEPDALARRTLIHVDARLRSGRNSLRGTSRIDVMSAQLAEQISGLKHGITLVPHSLQSEVVQDVSPPRAVAESVSLVLLIACVNVAASY